MLVRLACLALIASGSLLLAGCGPAKLDVSKSWKLEPGEARSVDVAGQSKPQTINVEFKSSAGDVTVCVFKEADCKTDDDLLDTPTSKAIVSKKGKGESFTADVPENTPVRVVARNPSETSTVDLKVTNKK
jgi:hypothetical protein